MMKEDLDKTNKELAKGATNNRKEAETRAGYTRERT